MIVKEVQAMSDPATFIDLEDMFQGVISSLLALAGIAIFLMLIIGGFKYILSGGNPEAAAGARRTITYAIIGLVLVASAYLILFLIETITGAQVTDFTIFQGGGGGGGGGSGWGGIFER
jgi:TRAP-type C4-dicarboxylate transport system permease small subunit